MVNYCRVKGCHNRSDRETSVSFYRLPEVITNQGEKTSEERRRLCLAKLDQNFSGKNLKNVRVCSDHFISKTRADLYQKDHPDWVPTVNMGTRPSTTPEMATDRYKRRKDRQMKTEMDVVEEAPNVEKCVQTNIDSSAFDAMESDLKDMRTNTVTLKQKLNTSTPFSEHMSWSNPITTWQLFFFDVTSYLSPGAPMVFPRMLWFSCIISPGSSGRICSHTVNI